MPSVLSRRQLLLLAGAAVRSQAAGEDFWNVKPAVQWDAGEIYRLLNHSPWAAPVQSLAQISLATTYPEPAPSDSWGPRCVITWESARPIRDALKWELPYAFDGCYVIGVDGMPRGQNGSMNRLKQFAVLRSKGKQKWTSHASVARELIHKSAVCAFGFPFATTPIDAAMTELFFESRFGKWQVTAKFRPKEMFYRGKVAL